MKKSTQGLREVLFDELDAFLSGKVDSDHVKAVTRLTGGILATVAKDLEAAKFLNEISKDRNTPQAVADLNLNLLLTAQPQASRPHAD